jgi:hypothetical protein
MILLKFKKLLAVFLAVVYVFSWCNDTDLRKPALKTATKDYDSVRFNKVFNLDTLGCVNVMEGRVITDTLINQIAFVEVTKLDTVIYNNKNRRFGICNFPGNINFRRNDTILVSGFVYSISGAENSPGYPTILYKIITSKENK